MAFCCFMPGSSFAYPLAVCYNKNDNDPSGSIFGSSLKAALKAWDRYPMVSLNVATRNLFFGLCKNSACLAACAKATKTSCLCQRLNLSRKTSLLRSVYCKNLHHLSQEQICLALVLSTFALAWKVTEAPSIEKSGSCWGPLTVKNRCAAG